MKNPLKRAKKDKAAKDAIRKPFLAWHEERERLYLDQEWSAGRGKKWIKGTIKELQVIVSLSHPGIGAPG